MLYIAPGVYALSAADLVAFADKGEVKLRLLKKNKRTVDVVVAEATGVAADHVGTVMRIPRDTYAKLTGEKS